MILWRKKNKDDPQKEIDRLQQQANQLYEHGQYDDAIDVLTESVT